MSVSECFYANACIVLTLYQVNASMRRPYCFELTLVALQREHSEASSVDA